MRDTLLSLLTVLIALVAVLGGTLMLDLPRRAATWTSQLFLTQILKGVALLATSLTLLQVLHQPLLLEQGLIFWILAALVILPFSVWYVTQIRPHPMRNAFAYTGMLVAVHLSLFVNAATPPATGTLWYLAIAVSCSLVSAWGASLLFRTSLPLRVRLGAVALGYTAATLLISAAFMRVALPETIHSWSSISAILVLGFFDILLLGLFLSAQRLAQDTQRQAAALTLEQAVQQAMSEHLNDAVVISDPQGQVIRLNARAAHDFELTSTVGARIYQWYDATFTAPLDALHLPLALALNGSTVRNGLYGLESLSGRRVARVNAGLLQGPRQERLGAVMTLTDVTGEVNAQATQEQMAQQYTDIVDALDEGVMLISPEGRVLQINVRTHQLLGLPKDRALVVEDLLQAERVRYVDGKPVTLRGENFRRLIAGQVLVVEELVHLDRVDGRTITVRSRGQALRRHGQVYALLYVLTDISDQLTLQKEVDRLANHWVLTGLPTRTHFLNLASAAHLPSATAFLVLSSVTGTALRREGRGALADAFTQCLARDLPLAYPDALLIGQLSQDTFALLLPRQLTALESGLFHPIHVQDDLIEPRFKAATRPLDLTENIEHALQEVEATLVHTEEGQLGVSEPAQYEAQLRHAQLERRLRLALQTGAFTTYFQPIYNLHDQRIREAEALVRWFDDELGFVPPDVFIPRLEAWNRIHVVTDLVIEAALVESRRISALAGYTVRVAVNLSAVELNAPDFLDRMEAVTRRAPDAGTRLTFEVTERAVLDHLPEVTRRLNVLRAWGFCLALDDFGTGYSALSVLQTLPVHFVKLDRSFVKDIETSGRLQVLTDAVMQLAQRLQLQVIAEGIETPAQEEILRHSGCNLGQGYLYARPQPHLDLR